MRLRAILNPAGGTLRGEDETAFCKTLAEAFAERGVSAELVCSPGADLQRQAQEALADARAARLDAVVVGGGDGSVGTVADVLAGTGVPLGILPLGTLNHFARDLGLPPDWQGAIEVIAGGRWRDVDVAEVNGRVFVNNSSVGLYPYMIADRERRQADDGHGKWIATALATWRALKRFPRRRLVIRAGGRHVARRTPCLLVSNNAYRTELMTLGQRDRLDGGLLYLYVAKQRDAAEALRLALRIALGGLDPHRDFELLRVAETEIGSSASRLLVSIDGEVTRLRPPLSYRIRPGALRVFAPPATDG